MASRRTFTTRGFTLIEMLIVIGLIAALGSAVLFIDLNSFRGDAFRAERTTIITLLEQARAGALNNVDEEPHGVAIFPTDYPDAYVLFVGTSYTAGASTNQVFPSSYKVELNGGSLTEVSFEQLSGNALQVGTITLRDPNRNITADITINHEGALIW